MNAPQRDVMDTIKALGTRQKKTMVVIFLFDADKIDMASCGETPGLAKLSGEIAKVAWKAMDDSVKATVKDL